MKKAILFFPRLLTSYLWPTLVFLFMLVAARMVAQTELWGMTSEGAFGYGTIIKLNSDGSGFARYAFENKGHHPFGSLIESGGKFYGMTNAGGSGSFGDNGVLFEYDPAGVGTYTVKHHFDGVNGDYPFGSLMATGGKFYGMTPNGGINDRGVLFEYDPAGAGTYTVKHHFDGPNGGYPSGSLIASGGKFYGMTLEGGSFGVLFEYDPGGAGTYTVKHYFDEVNGAYPYGSLIASSGKFYGMTSGGGSFGSYGVLFEYDPAGAGTYTVKHHFNWFNGGYPKGSLMASGGKFYGMTYEGGNYNSGVLFEYDPAGAGTYKIKLHFDGINGKNPNGNLIASGGKFYGMTYEGGNYNSGVLFEYNPLGAGTYTIKQHFDYTNGGYPYGSLTASGGKFYGMTPNGGMDNRGVLFEYDPAGAGTYTVKHHFAVTNGGNPSGSLITSDGKFYGMTPYGGRFGEGVLFEYDPAGAGTNTVKHHFDGVNGGNPYGSLMASGGKFYGMAYYGGSADLGVLFEYDPAGAGTYTVKHHFDGVHDRYPRGSLMASDGKFYGMTSGGDNFGSYGVLFEYDPAGAGTYTVIQQFDNTIGRNPHGSLMASGGKLYGMTSGGGSFGYYGVLFEYDPAGAGTYTVKHHFDFANGGNPYGSLIASGGKFYGMTSGGGINAVGVLFEYDPAGQGTYTVRHHFDGVNGNSPKGSLMESGGKFYGMTSYGGDYNSGVLFEYDPAGGGTYTVLRQLEVADGTRPYGDLIEVPLGSTTTSAEGPAFEMQVSPNPSGGQVAIEIFSEKALRGNLAVYDVQGNQITVLANDRIFQEQERIIWQTADLPAGVYFLRLQTEAGVYVEKFIRQ